MYGKLLYYLISFGPTVVVGLLGLRAARKRDDASWADHSDAALVLGWIAAPLILVATPLLAGPRGYANVSSGAIGTAAIALFCVASASFSPEKLSISARAKRVLISSGSEVGVGAYLVWSVVFGSIYGQTLTPSASLFLRVLWWSYMGRWGVGHLLRMKSKVLGPGELLDRIKQIAHRRGARLDHILVIRSVPGYAQCINAVAIRGNTVALFADLIARLSKAEVDAVVEHEVGHIADERLWTLDSSLRYGCDLVLLALIYVAEKHITSLQTPWSSLLYVMWIAVFVLPEVLSRWYSRRAERRANENVAHLTEPLSAVSAFYKLAMLNHHPISRPLWSRLISTHPCADEEVEQIAQRAGLSDEQLRQAYERAQAEIANPSGDRYELASPVDAVSGEHAVGEPVKRPGRWAGCGVFALCLTASIVSAGIFMLATLTVITILPAGLAVLAGFLGFFGCGLIIVLPVAAVNRRMQRRLTKSIRDHLEARYGTGAVERSVLVDALFPEWADRDQPWQGALLDVSDGQLILMGEVVELRIRLDTKISVSRWADKNSAGSEARMVLIACQCGNAIQTVSVRPLGYQERGAPRNWKQLEKHINSLISELGVGNTPLNEMLAARPRRLRWSRKVPIAILCYLGILAMADYLARTIGGGGWVSRVLWCLAATSFGGSGLWTWVTHAHKPDND